MRNDEARQAAGGCLGIIVVALVAVIVLSGCKLLGPVRLALGCEYIEEHIEDEKSKTHTQSLPDAYVQHGGANPRSVRSSIAGRYDAGFDVSVNTDESPEYARYASSNSENSPLVCP